MSTHVDDVYDWGGREPSQSSMDWFISREFGGKWYYLVPRDEIIAALDTQAPFFDTNPCDGDRPLEIP